MRFRVRFASLLSSIDVVRPLRFTAAGIASFLFLVPLFPPSAASPGIPLTNAGVTRYRIVIAQDADSLQRFAARELQSYLKRISGARPVILDDSTPPIDQEILIGRARAALSRVSAADMDRLGDEGVLVRTVGSHLILLGGGRKGTLYAVYDFLERDLGCRRYSASVTVTPQKSTITLPDIDRIWVPWFTHREIHYLNAMDRSYSDWHKLHSISDKEQNWGMWVHTFDRLVPPEKHFSTHPEYYSLAGGRRIPSGQLCLTNPSVYPILSGALRDMIARKPGARFWSVSQNDNFNECRCEACEASNARYGGSSGTLLSFVNRVARDFPDRTISTLAYEYTRSAPTAIRPEKNVNIMLCSIECNRSQPLAEDPRSASFRRDVGDWGRITDNILMWDYVVQFRNLVSPFPNLRVLQPNIRFFRDNNIRMMFQQGCGANVGEFGALRTYLIAKLLWDPDVNIDSVMDDFLDGYYGPAGRHVRRYIDRMHDALDRTKPFLNIFGFPYDGIASYLSPPLIKEYSRIFDDAEAAVAAKPDYLERVRTARLPLEFAILDISLRDVDADLTYYDKSVPGWRIRPEMAEKLDAFVRQAKKAGIARLEERGTSPDEFRESIRQMMRVSVQGNLAYGKPVTLLTTHSEKYPVGGGKALTDGLHGPNDFHCNWLGFEGEHMDAVIDLGSTQKIGRIRARFLQQWYSWIWLPRRVEYLLSEDGVNYIPISTVLNRTPDDEPGIFSHPFDASFPPIRARYVRVKAESILRCPGWHIGAGGKAWIFVDEIVVE